MDYRSAYIRSRRKSLRLKKRLAAASLLVERRTDRV